MNSTSPPPSYRSIRAHTRWPSHTFAFFPCSWHAHIRCELIRLHSPFLPAFTRAKPPPPPPPPPRSEITSRLVERYQDHLEKVNSPLVTITFIFSCIYMYFYFRTRTIDFVYKHTTRDESIAVVIRPSTKEVLLVRKMEDRIRDAISKGSNDFFITIHIHIHTYDISKKKKLKKIEKITIYEDRSMNGS